MTPAAPTNAWRTLAWIAGGYILAAALGAACVALAFSRMAPETLRASGGMVAAAEVGWFLVISGTLSLLPTGLLFWRFHGSVRFGAVSPALALAGAACCGGAFLFMRCLGVAGVQGGRSGTSFAEAVVLISPLWGALAAVGVVLTRKAHERSMFGLATVVAVGTFLLFLRLG